MFKKGHTFNEKMSYYDKRKNDKSLTSAQRMYAKGFVNARGGTYGLLLSHNSTYFPSPGDDERTLARYRNDLKNNSSYSVKDKGGLASHISALKDIVSTPADVNGVKVFKKSR